MLGPPLLPPISPRCGVILTCLLVDGAASFVRSTPAQRNFSRPVCRSTLTTASRPFRSTLTTASLPRRAAHPVSFEDDGDHPLLAIRGGFSLSPSRVTLLGATVNVLLSLLKLVVGTLSGSASLVADAYHSGSDLLVDAVTMAAVNAPPAFEKSAVYAIAFLLASTGGALVWSSLVALFRRTHTSATMGTPPLLVAVVAIAAKECLYRVTRAVGRRSSSRVLIASANHHRSDAISSLAAAIGSGGVLLGWPVADTLAAAVVGGMMVTMGVGVARGDH